MLDRMAPSAPLLSLAAVSLMLLPSPLHAENSCGTGVCYLPNPTPGCDNDDCCLAVCDFYPACCKVEWDASCVELAELLCLPIGVCGLSTAGSCFTIHANPACSDPLCCGQVCAVDPHCCSVQWDGLCVQRALLLCSTPGACGTATGACNQVHPTGGCADAACCELICGFDPHCCAQAWDFVCVAAANCYCYGGCNVTCPANGVPEFEPCGQKSNDPCFNPGGSLAGQWIISGIPLCARLFVAHPPNGPVDADVDVFVAQLGTEGAGLVTATLSLTSKKLAWAALLPAPPIGGCTPLEDAIVHVQSVNTFPGLASVCVDAGKYWVVASAGSFPQIGQTPPMTCAEGLIVLQVSHAFGCTAPCGDPQRSCFTAHDDPGCGSPQGCCQKVCSVDPYCCAVEWDMVCVVQAFQQCGGSPPINDLCEHAIAIGPGATPFSTILATTDGPPLPAACNEGSGLLFTNDIWFRYSPQRAGTARISTCLDATFDTRLAVYADSCPPVELLACSDDDDSCEASGSSSSMSLPVECGQTYLIRVGGRGMQGFGTLLISEPDGRRCACEGDLNGDGIVDGGDLGSMLGQWGACPGCEADLNQDGVVDGNDLGALLGLWGPC